MAVTVEQFLTFLRTYGYENADPIDGIESAIAYGEAIVRRASVSDTDVADILVMREAAKHLDLSQSGLPLKLQKDGSLTVHDADIRRMRNAIGGAKGAF
jgi:hypothetical protein